MYKLIHNTLPEDGLYHYLLQPGEEHNDLHKRATDRTWSKKAYRLSEVALSPGNQVMYHLKDGLERVFIKEELMLILKTQSCHWIISKTRENVPVRKMSFPTPEQFEESKVQHGSILKWQEVPMKVIYHIETVKQITTKSGRVTMVVSLIGEDRISLKAFATSCFKNDLRDFGLGGEWFIKPLDKCLSSRNPSQSYYHYEIMWH